MTHDELLVKIGREESFLKQHIEGINFVVTNAIRAVVELHKPVMAFTGGYDGLDNELWAEQCNDCSNNGFSQAYPCPTIKAIEKELQ